MLSCIIIEDETRSALALEQLLKKNCPDIFILGKAGSVKEGYSLFLKTKPEILFLDVMLSDGTGFDLLEKLNDLKFEVVFTTAHEKFAIKAIKYSALDYLLKPVDETELMAALQKVFARKGNTSSEQSIRSLLENIKQKDERYAKITLPAGNAYEVVLVKDIVRCEAEGSYTRFFLANGRSLFVSGILRHYEELLSENDFIRVHHSHLINKNHMIRFLKEDNGYVVMSDGSQVEVSRRKKEEFLKKIK